MLHAPTSGSMATKILPCLCQPPFGGMYVPFLAKTATGSSNCSSWYINPLESGKRHSAKRQENDISQIIWRSIFEFKCPFQWDYCPFFWVEYEIMHSLIGINPTTCNKWRGSWAVSQRLKCPVKISLLQILIHLHKIPAEYRQPALTYDIMILWEISAEKN